jgi:sulfide:quinone oxidoreductase
VVGAPGGTADLAVKGQPSTPRIVVVGGGWGGRAFIAALRRRVSPAVAEIVMVEPMALPAFTPDQIHAADWTAKRLLQARWAPAERLERLHVRWVRDIAVRVDPDRRRVHLAVQRPLDYDALVLAVGSHPRWDLVPGLDGGRLAVNPSPRAALLAALRGRFVAGGVVVLAAATRPDDAKMWPLDLPLIGVAALWAAAQADRRPRLEFVVISPWPALGIAVGKTGAQWWAQHLSRLGVHMLPATHVVRVDGNRLWLERGARIDADHTVWLPAHGPPALAARSGVTDGTGFIPVTATQQHPAWPELYAVGDGTDCPGGHWGSVAAWQAEQAAQHLAERLGVSVQTRGEGPMIEWGARLGYRLGIWAGAPYVPPPGPPAAGAWTVGPWAAWLVNHQRRSARRRGVVSTVL